mmetsp:Transcript_80022/g.248325  ORF Transcript_80022/g.248325 Transcript_80022/m.248325 type:complete len:154 (+) Transcript_80022:665-1126(+)
MRLARPSSSLTASISRHPKYLLNGYWFRITARTTPGDGEQDNAARREFQNSLKQWGPSAATGKPGKAGKPLPKVLTLENAAQYVPPVKRAFLFESASDNRVRAFYVDGSGVRLSTSASYKRYTPHECIIHCLKWLWSTHATIAGEPCPYKEFM